MKRIENYGKASFKAALQILLALSIFLSIAMPAAQAEEARTVRVGYFYLTGYHEIDAQGRLQGYGYDLLQNCAFTTIGTMIILAMSKSGTRALKCWSAGKLTLLPACASFPTD